MLPLFVVLVLGVFAQTFADEPEAIIGGSNANPGQFPYQVSIRSGNSENNYHMCGGTIIGNNCIATAAHCIENQFCDDIKVVAGSIYSSGGELRDVDKCIKHPKYVGTSNAAWKYDAAILKLKKPIQFNNMQNKIPLALTPPGPGANCSISGWGKTSENSGASLWLQYAKTGIMDIDNCRSYYPDVPLNESHLCCFAKYGTGLCNGDSGGPLVCNGALAGIISWVVPCARGYPDATCNVATVRDWLLEACIKN